MNRPNNQKAFTLVELLVVIGIILILMSFITWGFRHAHEASAKRATFADLQVCSDLLQEYQNVNGIGVIENSTPSQPVASGPANAPKALPVYSDPTIPQPGKAEIPLGDLMGPGGATDMGDRSSSASARYLSPAVLHTQDVMYLLLRDPRNRAIVSAMPPKRLLEAQSLNGQVVPPAIDRAVLLDEYGQPIIFVPAGGLHVMLTDRSATPPQVYEYVVRTSGVYRKGSIPPMSPADRPFWASAGQDGDMHNGDDNIYSFQK